MITLYFRYPTTGDVRPQLYTLNGIPCRDRRKARRIVRLTRRAVARLQAVNPSMPTFVDVTFKVS